MAEDLLIFLAVLSGLLLIFIGGELALRLYLWLARSRKMERRRKLLIPHRYVGCVTCEGAEAVSTEALIRHQVRDHAGAVQW